MAAIKADILTTMLVMEGLGYGCHDNGLIFALNAQMWSIQHPILAFGSEEQKQKYIPKLIDGTLIGAWDDRTGVRLRCVQPENTCRTRSWRLCAQRHKMFVTSAPISDLSIVFATVDPAKGIGGISAFIVENGTPGYSTSRDIAKMGLRTSPMGELVLEDCFIPEENRIGPRKESAAACLAVPWNGSAVVF